MIFDQESESKLISWSDYRNGFRMHACPQCGSALTVPFTCKSRLRVFCYREKLYGWSMNLSHIIKLKDHVRQIVLYTILLVCHT